TAVGATSPAPDGSVHAPGRIDSTAGVGTRSVARTFPAYIGRFTSNAPSFTDASVQSAAYAQPSFAATRAARSRPLRVAPVTTTSAPLDFACAATAFACATG